MLSLSEIDLRTKEANVGGSDSRLLGDLDFFFLLDGIERAM